MKTWLLPFSLNSDTLLFTKQLKLLNDNLANLCLFRTADVGEIDGSWGWVGMPKQIQLNKKLWNRAFSSNLLQMVPTFRLWQFFQVMKQVYLKWDSKGQQGYRMWLPDDVRLLACKQWILFSLALLEKIGRRAAQGWERFFRSCSSYLILTWWFLKSRVVCGIWIIITFLLWYSH